MNKRRSVLVRQALDVKKLDALGALEGPRGLLTSGDEEGYPFGGNAPRDKCQCVERCRVEPMGVIDRDQERSLFGRLGKQREGPA